MEICKAGITSIPNGLVVPIGKEYISLIAEMGDNNTARFVAGPRTATLVSNIVRVLRLVSPGHVAMDFAESATYRNCPEGGTLLNPLKP